MFLSFLFGCPSWALLYSKQGPETFFECLLSFTTTITNFLSTDDRQMHLFCARCRLSLSKRMVAQYALWLLSHVPFALIFARDQESNPYDSCPMSTSFPPLLVESPSDPS
ncbi:Uncharacterized protein HZ326_0699 [Fusarium oxysporum f. sp. albedinis]|nr:Uncharacterized protein HZ326_0699 [Fusarium oxysporum f. sp. albedinis]